MNKGFLFTDDQMNRAINYLADLYRTVDQPDFYTDEAREQAFNQYLGAKRLLVKLGFKHSEVFEMIDAANIEFENQFKVTA